ncbi:MAG: tetratricopeptide repeat protein [Candidatus Thorarchaeota archaeon]|nr:tetratricopeptide repeat protein [Candidatus Thorarchaeota archaeon]
MVKSDRLKLAEEALEDGRIEEAMHVLEAILEEDDDNPDAMVLLGLAYLQSAQPQRAVSVLTKAEELVEEHCVLCLFLGRAYKALENYDSAEKYLTRALALGSDVPEAWADLAEVHYQRTDYRQAAKLLDEGVGRFPNDSALHNLRAMVLHKQGDYTEAAQEWGVLFHLNPDSLIALTNYAYSSVILGRFEEAAPLVERAIAMAPNDYRTKMLAAEYYFQSGLYHRAETLFGDALKMSSDSVEALGRLAVISKYLGAEKESNKYLERAWSLTCEDCDSWYRLCDALLRLGEHEKMFECLRRATEHDPNSAAPWVLLAVELGRRGQRTEAERAWRKSIELRGYIKAHCSICNTSFKVSLPTAQTASQISCVRCTSCQSEAPIPDSLASI